MFRASHGFLPHTRNLISKMSQKYNKISIDDLLNKTGSNNNASSSASSSAPDNVAFECTEPLCGRKFVSEEALKAHKKRSHAAPTSYVCQRCKSTFSTLPNLNKHVSYFLSEISLRFYENILIYIPSIGKSFVDKNSSRKVKAIQMRPV